MTHNGEKTCDVAISVVKAHSVKVIESEKETGDKDSDSGLEHIAEKRHTRRALTVGAEHIGHTRIAATVFSDIIVVEYLRYDDSRINASEKISRYHSHYHKANEKGVVLPLLLKNIIGQVLEKSFVKVKHSVFSFRDLKSIGIRHS